ncbi:hypothetical protein HG264_13885 [Pseudomonas sp. gcc21]|uniref:hypothetical protein n=1 Tax=Pseudomonas sp. gcc21 TaxID=2726989 RepID=UPI0014528A48|nr:hypothetical protein [Pseudomonas sp. gcc21]QJD59917.1 hypothetical protein HG264_13885 [Pseudomonas sp. gcc21]
MTKARAERRKDPKMRAHVDQMIASGAVILGRKPLKIIYRGKLHTLSNGVLISEGLNFWPIDAVVVEV